MEIISRENSVYHRDLEIRRNDDKTLSFISHSGNFSRGACYSGEEQEINEEITLSQKEAQELFDMLLALGYIKSI